MKFLILSISDICFVQRLSSADYVLCSNSLCLINALMRYVSDHHWESFIDMMIKLKIRKVFALLMNEVYGDESSKQLLEFQSLFVRQTYRWKRTQVSLHIPSRKESLKELWTNANLSDESRFKIIPGFMKKGIDDYRKTMLEQCNRPAER
ncbi:hypothetical protein RCL_jg15194.t1 [Rhizophagus clarus]|uniref:ELMO armadillo-like helical domain-containing protein n=1 Tax=Rhizophagus clarus TaxID=94130 RepID=A0A8H3KYV3_9GLOM|nr:hypothetical protein RCL_jg15194.t1 [Rhizophagus clarus]